MNTRNRVQTLADRLIITSTIIMRTPIPQGQLLRALKIYTPANLQYS